MKRRRRYRDRYYDPREDPSPSPPPPAVLLKKRRRNNEVAKHVSDLTEVERKVWVGNLNSTTFDENRLKSIFTNLCPIYGITRKQPIESIWLSKERNFCFVEFRNIKDAEIALEKWRNVVIPELNTQGLPVGPPRERTNHSDELTILKDYVLGESLPRWTSDQLKQIQDKIYAKNKDHSFQERYKPQRPRGEINIPIPGKGSFQAQTQNPDATTVLKVRLRRSAKQKSKDDASDDGENENSNALEDAIRQIRRERKLVALKEELEEDCIFAMFRDVDSAIEAKEGLSNLARKRFRVKFVEERSVDFRKGKTSKNTGGGWTELRKTRTE